MKKTVISGILAVSVAASVCVTGSFYGSNENISFASSEQIPASIVNTGELTAKRTEFVKQFSMSDGSYTAVTYSMPVHYKKSKGGNWKEIDTTLVKSGKKNYKTKATDLSIRVSKKANKKSIVSMKRGKSRLSLALKGKKVRAAKAKVSNPKKSVPADVLNQNKVTYKKVLKNTNVSYDIFPEKVQEIVSVNKKQKRKSYSFQTGTALKVKVKGKKVYFKSKKGKTKFTRMGTKITDANGVTTSKVKLSYNKKKKILKVTPDKKWWNSKRRKFPLEIRTTYLTDKHRRDVKVGAAYAGSPNSNYGYDKSLLLQANKCVAFTKMSTLAELKQPNVQILDASLNIKNEKTMKLGAGKTFDIGVHKVKQNWSVNALTYNNRPAYEAAASATVGLQKAGNYQCDVTGMVKDWYAGEASYGVALVADNANRAYQAKIDRNPYFSVHYEIVGFEGAVELKENQPLTRSVLQAGQENYYYFDAKSGIAYDLYTTSALDTQGTLYDSDKKRVGFDDNSGLGNNFSFVRSYDGRRYLKVNTKGTATGEYTLTLKKRFDIAEPTGKIGQDSYIISWNPIEHAKQYVVTIYDTNGKVGEAFTADTSYEYVYTPETVGKTLAFTVTPEESEHLMGEPSRKIYNRNNASEWNYDTPMSEGKINFASAVCKDKVYILGGENRENGTVCKDLEVFDTQKQTWKKVSRYPEHIDGICNAAMVTLADKLYVIGGQTNTGSTAKTIKEVYCYEPDSNRWEKLADLPEGRTGVPVTVCDGKIYVFAKAGTTEQVDIYNPSENKWSSTAKADTSVNLQAQTIDGKIFVLREKASADGTLPAKVYWEEYLPESGEYDNAGSELALTDADRYQSGTVINSKIYMVNNNRTNQVICYDIYLDTWNKVPVLNLQKEFSQIQSVGSTLYNIGGYMQGFGILDVLEVYPVKNLQITKPMDVKQGESYELQVNAGKCEDNTDYLVTVRIDTKMLAFRRTSSFMQKEEMKKGKDGVQLMSCTPEKGVMVLKLHSKMEAGVTFEAYQSIPVMGLQDGTTIATMEVEKK